jgi:hypothetical protein
LRARSYKYTEEQAALLIQKMWRGYKTRKLINHYIILLNKKKVPVEIRPVSNNKANFNETKKYKKHGRKLSDLVDMEKTQKIASWSLKAGIE